MLRDADGTKRVALFGSTGSIGCSTLDVVRQHPERFTVSVLSANENAELLAKQAREFQPEAVVIKNESKRKELKALLGGTSIKVMSGEQALIDVAGEPCDLTLAAIVGAPGLLPTLEAIKAGNSIALANKETLVCAGDLVMAEAAKRNVKILPVDSEHCAVFQCFETAQRDKIDKVTITASGGPFRTWSKEQIDGAQLEQALKHPSWTMGQKITIDSATLMNKGLELIEAKQLFDLRPDQLDTVVHPQSIIHALVQYCDGSVLAQLANPDMRLPIAYAMAWPERIATPCPSLDLVELAKLTFEAPSFERFPCLRLAIQAMSAGGNATTVLNAANEEAVSAFLNRKIGFMAIPTLVETALEKIDWLPAQELPQIIDSDSEARQLVRHLITKS